MSRRGRSAESYWYNLVKQEFGRNDWILSHYDNVSAMGSCVWEDFYQVQDHGLGDNRAKQGSIIDMAGKYLPSL